MNEPKKYTIKVLNHSKIDGHLCYQLEISSEGAIYKVDKRFSDIKTLNETLRRETTNLNSFPKFPPSKLFLSEEFLKKRGTELNNYFEAITTSPEYSKLKSFIKFMETCTVEMYQVAVPKSSKVAKISMKANFKSMITPFKEKFRPKNSEFKKLNQEEYNKLDEDGKKVINNYKYKFIKIDYQIEQNNSETCEEKYKNIISKGNVFQDEEKEINEGDENNFNFMMDGKNENDNIKESIQKKIEELNIKEKELFNFYGSDKIILI